MECDTAEDIERFGKDLIILDAAKGIKKVSLITDLDHIEQAKPYSMHDFDLGLTLKLLKKMGKVSSVRIIAIPVGYNEKKAVEEVEYALSFLFSSL